MPKTSTSEPLEVKQAANQAAKYLKELIPNVDRVLLEEVEKIDDYWLITLSYKLITNPGDYLFELNKRDYKTFKINIKSGEVVSMKMKTV